MKKETNTSLKKLLAAFMLEFVPIFLTALAIPYVLSATTFPVDLKVYKIFGLVGIVTGWLKIRDIIMITVAEIFFSEE